MILEAAGGVVEFTPQAEDAVRGSILAWNGLIPLREALIMD